MKQKDIALILVVGFISAIASFLLSGLLINKASNRQLTAPIVEAIDSKFQEPNTKYFNENSVDPTSLIQIGDGANPKPFDGKKP